MAKQKQPVRQKHVPQRTCVVCRETMDKRALTRIVNDPQEGVVVDPGGKRSGRGAYLCPKDACWEQALTTDVLSRALRTPLAEQDRVRLREMRPRRLTQP